MFLQSYTYELQAKILASEFCSIDFETTGLTPTSIPVAMMKSVHIGNRTLLQYKKLYPDCKIDCSLRARIYSVGIDTGEVLVFDLDKLTEANKKSLIEDTINDKIIIGHNLSFDLSWAISIAGHDLHPEFVIDTLLLARVMKPNITFRLHELAAHGDADCVDVIAKNTKNHLISLESLSVSHGLGKMDKTYQKPANWCVSTLSDEHFAYVKDDVLIPLCLYKIIINCEADIEFCDSIKLLKKIDNEECGGTYQRVYQHVPLALSKMAQRGIPIHEETLDKIELFRQGQMQGLVDDLIAKIPSMEKCREKLESSKPGVTAELKVVLAEYAKMHGYILDENEKGEIIIKAKDAHIKGCGKLDGWAAWDKLQHNKKIYSLCGSFRGVSKAHETFQGYRKLIPVMSAIAVTLRTITGEPNVQNLPRPQRGLEPELQFRSIVKAPEGYSLVINDYGQIELRIAAALSIRNLKVAQNIIDRKATVYGDVPDWIRNALIKGADFNAVLKPDAEGFRAFADSFALSYRNALKAGTLMAEAFRAGIDPHLMTALNMAVTQGLFDTNGLTAFEYLKNLTKEESKALAKTLKTQRQSAKALNFGLLYGMQTEGLWSLGVSDYGLDWSMNEAQLARDAWFILYPEIAFWQDFIRVVSRGKADEAKDMMLRNRYTKKIETRSVRVGFSHTLSGRPVVAELPREITNYSDQGSGADMMLEAIITLDDRFKECVINTIHDEVMMLVRDEDVDDGKAALKKAMIDAANRVLSPYGIPAEAEPDVVKFWRKVD